MKLPYIDMHCDTLTDWLTRGEMRDLGTLPDKMVDLDRLAASGAMCQFFAIHFKPRAAGLRWPSDEEMFRGSRELLRSSAERNRDRFALAHQYDELQANYRTGRVSGILTFEDSRILDGDLDKIRFYHDQDVRCMGLVWNAGPYTASNCLGSPNVPGKTEEGLTPFGRDAVREMQRVGVLVDVSHLSDGGFWDVVDLAEKPFVASHSSCRAVCDRLRNLTDEMIRVLADKGGVSGVNFCPDFIASREATSCTVEQIAAHALHFIRVGGEDCVAIGTDFDGTEGTPEIDEPTKMERLYRELERRGVTPRQLDKLFSGNVLRVIREAMQ